MKTTQTVTVLDRFRLDNKVIIVTGASSGLGVSFAEACAQAGADVVLAARRVEKLCATAALVRQAGRRSHSVATDITDPDQCDALVDAVVTEFGRVDVLVNNAGVGGPRLAGVNRWTRCRRPVAASYASGATA